MPASMETLSTQKTFLIISATGVDTLVIRPLEWYQLSHTRPYSSTLTPFVQNPVVNFCLDPRKWLSHTRLSCLSTFDTLCPSDSLIPPFRLAPYLDKSPKIVFLWRRRFCTEPCCQLCWNAFVCIQAEFWRACICRMQPWWLPWEVGEQPIAVLNEHCS